MGSNEHLSELIDKALDLVGVTEVTLSTDAYGVKTASLTMPLSGVTVTAESSEGYVPALLAAIKQHGGNPSEPEPRLI